MNLPLETNVLCFYDTVLKNIIKMERNMQNRSLNYTSFSFIHSPRANVLQVIVNTAAFILSSSSKMF